MLQYLTKNSFCCVIQNPLATEIWIRELPQSLDKLSSLDYAYMFSRTSNHEPQRKEMVMKIKVTENRIVLLGIILLLVLGISRVCFSSPAEEEQQPDMGGVFVGYIKDSRTDICFAYLSSPFTKGSYVVVPCDRIPEKLLNKR